MANLIMNITIWAWFENVPKSIFCLNENKNIWPSVQKSSHDHEVMYLISELEILLNLRYLSMFYLFIYFVLQFSKS